MMKGVENVETLVMKEVFEHLWKRDRYLDVKKNTDFILGLEFVGLGSINGWCLSIISCKCGKSWLTLQVPSTSKAIPNLIIAFLAYDILW